MQKTRKLLISGLAALTLTLGVAPGTALAIATYDASIFATVRLLEEVDAMVPAAITAFVDSGVSFEGLGAVDTFVDTAAGPGFGSASASASANTTLPATQGPAMNLLDGGEAAGVGVAGSAQGDAFSTAMATSWNTIFLTNDSDWDVTVLFDLTVLAMTVLAVDDPALESASTRLFFELGSGDASFVGATSFDEMFQVGMDDITIPCADFSIVAPANGSTSFFYNLLVEGSANTQLAPVPEPGGALALATGFGVLQLVGPLRRRRNR